MWRKRLSCNEIRHTTNSQRRKHPTPASKSRFEMLLSVKEHEMHHRGQLMVAQRVLGIVPHLTRLREEQAAQMQAQPASSS